MMDGMQFSLFSEKSQDDWSFDCSRAVRKMLRLPSTVCQPMGVSFATGGKNFLFLLFRYTNLRHTYSSDYSARLYDAGLFRRPKVLETAKKVTNKPKVKVLHCWRIRIQKDASTLSCNYAKRRDERRDFVLAKRRRSLRWRDARFDRLHAQVYDERFVYPFTSER